MTTGRRFWVLSETAGYGSTMRTPSRRAVLAGSLFAVAGCGSSPVAGQSPNPAGTPQFSSKDTSSTARATDVDGSVHDGWFDSTFRRTRVQYRICLPPGHTSPAGLPVVVALHGFGGNSSSLMDIGFPGLLSAAVKGGARPLAWVTVDGGSGSYYHRRADGTDAGEMVMQELVPRLRQAGFDTARLGLFGFSMGGYGALLLAAENLKAVRAVAVTAPALWQRAGDTPAVAFDSAQDYHDHDVYADVAVLQRIPLRIDCGDQDPFAAAVRAFRARFRPEPKGGFAPGSHTTEFVQSRLPGQLAFLAAHL